MFTKARVIALIILCVVGVLSLGLITWADRICFLVVQRVAPQINLLSEIRIPSLLLCLTVYLLTGPIGSYRAPKPDTNWRMVFLVFAGWLIPSAFLIFIVGIWTPTISTPIDIIAFLMTGLLAEEFLFRGAIYQLAGRVFPEIKVAQLPVAAVGISALLFGLQHFQYHHFQLTSEAYSQVGSTVLMGMFLGILRPLTGSIWSGITLHLLTNLMVVLQSLCLRN